MDKKTIKKIIYIVICLLFLTLIIISISRKKQEEKELRIKESPRLEMDYDVKKTEIESTYFEVQNCINTYFLALKNKDNAKIINLLNKNFIKENKITEKNVLKNNYDIQDKYEYFIANSIYEQEVKLGTVKRYFVFGRIISSDETNLNNVYIILDLDYKNKTFDITIPEEKEIDKESFMDLIKRYQDNAKEEDYNEIELNDNNKIMVNTNVIYNYFKNFIMLSVYDTEEAYYLLDEEYRNAKFENLDEYRSYIEKNKNNILNSSILKTNEYDKEDYYEYIIQDTNNYYYIFRIKDFMDYEVLLDMYTIDIDQLTKKYDSENEQTKVEINVQKVIWAIYNEDYEYIYNKLDDTFKENNYSTFEEFEDFMKNTFKGKLVAEIVKFLNEGKTFISDVSFRGTTSANPTNITMQIIMKLKENRDFVMSFSLQ